MLRPETARQLKEAGLVWQPKPGDAFMPEEEFGEEVFITDGGRSPEPGDVWLPDVKSMVREISTRGRRLMVMIYPKECHLKVYDAHYNSADMTGPAEDFADLVGRVLLFVLNMERGKETQLRTGRRASVRAKQFCPHIVRKSFRHGKCVWLNPACVKAREKGELVQLSLFDLGVL